MSAQPSALWTQWSGPSEFRGPFERYWKSDPAFSKSTLDEYRNNTAKVSKAPWPTSRGTEDGLLKDDFPTDPALRLHNQIHPFFQPTNFITELPLDEVRDVLQPVLQLASQFLTDDHALEWFAHAKFATLYPTKNAPGMLIRRAEPLTKDKLAIVKKQIDGLVGHVAISFASRIAVQDLAAPDYEACATYDQDQVLRIIKATPAERAMYNGRDLLPIIFLSTRLFHQAMWHDYSDTTPAQTRSFQLQFATILLHEFAHVWMGLCHPSVPDEGEPFICSSDSFPEAGFSWEQHMFGAQVSAQGSERMLVATAFASQFVAPRYNISSIVPVAYVNKWFLHFTWENFARIHTSGALFAPSPDRDTSAVYIGRYCPTSALNIHCYMNGVIDSKRCCTVEACNISFPYEDPTALRTQLLNVLATDVKLAKSKGARHGKYIEDQLLGSGGRDHYDRIIDRMEASLVGEKAACMKWQGGKLAFLFKGLLGIGGAKREDVIDL